MITEYLKVDKTGFNSEELVPAAKALINGELVAFPTETVYGLGAVFNDDPALKRIFQVKGRPGDNPLILHIWERKQLEELVVAVSPKHEKLMAAFWPGPLTLIFPKKPELSPVISAGLPTVAVRMPSHPVAQELLRLTGLAVAAPSANLSGKPSPTRGSHVRVDLDGKIPFIIDGGPCDAGIESTVVCFDHGQPVILRPGAVTAEMMEAVLGESVEQVGLNAKIDRPQAPGMKYRHYAPKAPVTLVEGSQGEVAAKINQLLQETGSGVKQVVICFSDNIKAYENCIVLDLGPRNQPEIAAERLYDLLRDCDQLAAEQIYIEGIENSGIGAAVQNRVYKAAGGKVVHA